MSTSREGMIILEAGTFKMVSDQMVQVRDEVRPDAPTTIISDGLARARPLSRRGRSPVAVGGKAENICSIWALPVLTQTV
jgi:hypothetical protein